MIPFKLAKSSIHLTMNNLNRISILSFLILIALFPSCKKETQVINVPAGTRNYIHAFTSGVVSRTAVIEVQFASDIIGADAIGSEVDAGLFAVSPKIKGKAVWTNARTISFEKAEWLESNEEYVVSVQLKKLFPEIEKTLSTFKFNFATKELFAEVKINSLKAVSNSDLKNQILEGVVSTNDVIEKEQVEKAFLVSLKGQSPAIEWNHLPNHTEHQFKIINISRSEKDVDLELKWNGKKLGSDQVSNTSYSVPSVNSFKLMQADVVQGEEQYLSLRFSDPIKKGQSFKGLIKISGYEGKLRFDVNDNELRVYPNSRLAGERTINVMGKLVNIVNVKMESPTQWKLAFEELKPLVKITGKGVILPNSEGLIFPFEAVNLKAIDLEVFKIYNNNILQFLQNNSLADDYRLYEVGRVVLQKKIELKNLNASANSNKWEQYALDLNGLINQEPGAIYQLRIGFQPSYTTYNCSSNDANENIAEKVYPEFEDDGEIKSFYDGNYYGIGGYYSGYNYKHQKDPCYPAYYQTSNFVRRNVMASNLGVITKLGNDGSLFAQVSDLRTAKPISGATVEVYDYQQQELKTMTTDGEGKIFTDTKRKPGFIIAKNGDDIGYVKMEDGFALSTSRFDVGGTVVQKGLKGYIYGERGVWRPGDSLYLNFVLEDLDKKLPNDHPVNFELYDARNQLIEKRVLSQHVNHVYPMNVATKSDDPTGNWRGVVKVGGATFSKNLKVETIKPNRLKIKLDFNEVVLKYNDVNLNANLQVNWLHGAPGRNLLTKIEMQLKTIATKFSKYNDFVFDDPARKYKSKSSVIFDKEVGSDGSATVTAELAKDVERFPGKLKVDFRIRAFEKGGDFSEQNKSLDYFPFESFVGLSIPKSKYGQKRLDIGKEKAIDFVVVDNDGNPITDRDLTLGLYEVNWRWWWENNGSDLNKFNSSTHFNAYKKATLTTDRKGQGSWDLKVDHWGRYLVRVCDTQSGHCSGDFFYAGYPWYGDSDDGMNRQAASMLLFKSDKENYDAGEQVELNIPTSKGSKILVTLETGNKVLETFTIDSKEGETDFSFYTTKEMSPTVYAHVALIQEHANTKNDLPIRMYGVIPINVEDPKTRLMPTIRMADVLEPEGKVRIEVEEDNNNSMAYTLAVVDDGLLDLTNFKTPNPWDAFYAREALGVKTWDVYDYVIGAYGGPMNRLLSVGGDDEVVPERDKDKANRFKPVVKHFGPFYLEKGKKAVHEFVMPNYVGSVRVMVVGSNEGAYGAAEKTCPVRKPLMVLGTLPRVLGPGETLRLPVSVFAMEEKVKQASITLQETTGLVNLVNYAPQQVNFNGLGEEMAYFDLKIPEQTGVAKFIITAEGAGEKASQEIEIDIRNPNPYVTEIEDKILQAGETWDALINAPGVSGTNKVSLELSSIPPINLEKWMNYLVTYPHGCVEQTTSKVFAQLYLDEMTELSTDQKSQIDYYVREAISRLSKFQTSYGGLSYWPGESRPNYWGSSFATHFLLEAKEKGYAVPAQLLNKLIGFQRSTARKWTNSTLEGYYSGNYQLDQAYRLYTLALAGEPEFGAMNRLRSTTKLSNTTKWRLAAAYAMSGQKEVASEIVNGVPDVVKNYVEMSYTYGSSQRDKAMILETMLLLDDNEGAARMAKEISDYLGERRWIGTQTLSYMLYSFSKLSKTSKLSKKIRFAYELAGKGRVEAGTDNPIFIVDVPADKEGINSFNLQNTSEGILYARIVKNGQPLIGNEKTEERNLKINVQYKNLKGETISPDQIEQGVDFVAEVSVSNRDKSGRYQKELALSQIFPSGWEILNTRMSSITGFENSDEPTYKDIRDDRVYSYFDIPSGESKTFRVQLNAAYPGRYYLAGPNCEAMYDDNVYAREAGRWIEVVEPEVY